MSSPVSQISHSGLHTHPKPTVHWQPHDLTSRGREPLLFISETTDNMIYDDKCVFENQKPEKHMEIKAEEETIM